MRERALPCSRPSTKRRWMIRALACVIGVVLLSGTGVVLVKDSATPMTVDAAVEEFRAATPKGGCSVVVVVGSGDRSRRHRRFGHHVPPRTDRDQRPSAQGPTRTSDTGGVRVRHDWIRRDRRPRGSPLTIRPRPPTDSAARPRASSGPSSRRPSARAPSPARAPKVTPPPRRVVEHGTAPVTIAGETIDSERVDLHIQGSGRGAVGTRITMQLHAATGPFSPERSKTSPV